MNDLGFSVGHKSVTFVSWKFIDDEDISFPSFSSTKQGHELKQTKIKTFVFVEVLKSAIWNVLTIVCFDFFLEFSFGGVSLVCQCCLPSYLHGI